MERKPILLLAWGCVVTLAVAICSSALSSLVDRFVPEDPVGAIAHVATVVRSPHYGWFITALAMASSACFYFLAKAKFTAQVPTKPDPVRAGIERLKQHKFWVFWDPEDIEDDFAGLLDDRQEDLWRGQLTTESLGNRLASLNPEDTPGGHANAVLRVWIGVGFVKPTGEGEDRAYGFTPEGEAAVRAISLERTPPTWGPSHA